MHDNSPGIKHTSTLLLNLVYQNGGLILVDMVGPFHEVLGWLWYLLVSFLSLLTFGLIITLNLVRIFLILMVRVNTFTIKPY